MRKYEPIWLQLRDNFIVSLEADIALHNKIIQGVIKEKWRDLSWKLLCSEEGNTYRLSYTIDNTCITFTLVIDTTIKNL